MKTKEFYLKFSEGFTLIEILVALGIAIIIGSIILVDFQFLKEKSNLNNESDAIISALKLAQNKTLSSEGASSYGVYFNTSTNPQEYTIFRGSNYVVRNPSFDENKKLSDSVEIYETNLGISDQVIFQRLTGYVSSTLSYDTISIRLKNNITETQTIYIGKTGLTGIASPVSASEDFRITDSRHVHFDYNRIISTSTDKIILTVADELFSTTKEIIIVDNIKDGQIFWEGEVILNGNVQNIKIHTHYLNNLNTQFCVHRDGRYNNKSLDIMLSEDDTGNLISYDALGQESRGSSIYLIFGEQVDPQRQ